MVNCKKVNLLVAIVVICIKSALSQVTGLSGWNICLDPAHSKLERKGIYNYSEAEKNLGVARYLKEMLLSTTDIDTVYMTRSDSIQNVPLAQRVAYANNLEVSWYHSLHSDSGHRTLSGVVILWGERWRGWEKTPYGGKEMSLNMAKFLPAAMRAATFSGGATGDCSYYRSFDEGPYLFENHYTNMPSEVSLAGYISNATQNVLFMNNEWKKLEAQALYWGILKKFKIPRPYIGICTGILTDLETNIDLNGAKVTIGDKSYTTDSYISLFHKYSTDSTQLHNGFYYIEDIPRGTHKLTVSAPGYHPLTTMVTMADTFFTFKDLKLVSALAPKITRTSILQGDSLYAGMNELVITFSRSMDTASVNNSISFLPSAQAPSLVWSTDEKTVSIETSVLSANKNYSLKIAATAKDKFSHFLDGNGSGIQGVDYYLNFNTKYPHTVPPSLTYLYPSSTADSINLTPVFLANFDEELRTTSVSGKISLVKSSDQSSIPIYTKLYLLDGKTVMNVFTRQNLELNQNYTFKIAAGIKDVYGTPTTSDILVEFQPTLISNNLINIDNFEAGINNWMSAPQSASSVGIIKDSSFNSVSTTIFNYLTSSFKSMKVKYGWNKLASNWLIRVAFIPLQPSFGKDVLLQTYLFGDGKGNKFRFCVTDQGAGGKEVSPWIAVNWYGWRLVSWDLKQGQTGSWLGNGILEPPLNFDSFQMTYLPGNDNFGAYYFDDFRVSNYSIVVSEDTKPADALPKSFTINQNYPNPFNPETKITFSLPNESNVKLVVYSVLGETVKELVNEIRPAGYYTVQFNGSGLPSGVYFYKMEAKSVDGMNIFRDVKKLVLMK